MPNLQTYISNKDILKLLQKIEDDIVDTDYDSLLKTSDIENRFQKLLHYYTTPTSDSKSSCTNGKLSPYPGSATDNLDLDYRGYIQDISDCSNLEHNQCYQHFRLYLKDWKLPNRELTKSDWSPDFLFEIYNLICQEKIDLLNSILYICRIETKYDMEVKTSFETIANFYTGLITEEFTSNIIAMIKELYKPQFTITKEIIEKTNALKNIDKDETTAIFQVLFYYLFINRYGYTSHYQLI